MWKHDHNHLGAHTIGNKNNQNILISFASFENDGSSTKRPRQGVLTPTVKMEDLEQHEQYKKISPQSSVLFYSLNDYDTCEDVEEFLDKIRRNIFEDKASISAKARTNLFLQDFPSDGM